MAEKVLFVDDEPNVLQSIRRNLRRRYSLETAESGQDALNVLERDGPFAVIVSDMRMPEMDGAELLSIAKERAPTTVRIMLTGNADQQTAIDAINKGDILRFLTKPSSTGEISAAVDAGLTQHRLLIAEQELLQETVRGSVQALAEVLALSDPEVFGRSTRLKNLMNKVASKLNLENTWELEAAALLSQIGCVSLQSDLVRKKLAGVQLDSNETKEFLAHPAAGADLLASIPRMEDVANAIRYQEKYYDGSGSPADAIKGDAIPIGARILRAILDVDSHELAGDSSQVALERLTQRPERYDPSVVDALASEIENAEKLQRVTVKITALTNDMLLASDLKTTSGTLLVAKGQQTTPSVRHHLSNYREKGLIGEMAEVWQKIETT